MEKSIGLFTGRLIREAAKIHIQLPTFNYHSSQPKDATVIEVEPTSPEIDWYHYSKKNLTVGHLLERQSRTGVRAPTGTQVGTRPSNEPAAHPFRNPRVARTL